MGVFTTTKTWRLGLNLMPQWWLSGASIDLDFDQQRYYDSSLAAGVQSLAPLNSYLSCSRASTGYAKTSGGTLTNFGNDTLRITTNGLLVEGARTNVNTYSQAINATNYVANNSTYTDNAAVAPDGTTTMSQMFDDATNDRHLFYRSGVISAATTYTMSVFVRDVDRRYFALIMNDTSTGNSNYIYVDLQTGASIGSGTTGAAATYVGSSIEAFANSTWRISLTGSTTNGAYAFFAMWNSGSLPGAPQFPGYAGSGQGVYVWGAQVEVGGFASSLIPTSGASAMRAADSISISGTAQTLINASTATIVCALGNSGGGSFAANAVDSNGTNLLGFNASNNALASITATLATSNTGNRSTTADDKLGLAWSGAGRSLCLNGGTVATDATAQIPSATQKLGSAAGTSNHVYSYFERLTIWNSKLADATLQSMTTL